MGHHFNRDPKFNAAYVDSMIGFKMPKEVPCCKRCRHSFKWGEKAVQAIRDRETKGLVSFVIDAVNGIKVHDDLNNAEFPCPICGHGEWTMGGKKHRTRYIYQDNPNHKQWWGNKDWYR